MSTCGYLLECLRFGPQLMLCVVVVLCKGIKKVDASLKDQLIVVEGTAAPSAIVAAIQGTGRDAILRGSGTSNSNPPLAA